LLEVSAPAYCAVPFESRQLGVAGIYFRGAGRWMCQSLRPQTGQVFPPTVLII
jgi:hypothetical protein